MKTHFYKFFIFILLLADAAALSAQQNSVRMVPSGRNAEKYILSESLRREVEFLSAPSFGGRASGTRGATEAAFWISRHYASIGLMPFDGSWSRSFRLPAEGGTDGMHGTGGTGGTDGMRGTGGTDGGSALKNDDEGCRGAVGRNIIGFLPGKNTSGKDKYVIIAAHYDSHGVIDGNLYPGADSNASGVVAMLNLAVMFGKMKELGRDYGKNLIFVATDAKERNSAGAEALMAEIRSGSLRNPSSGEAITMDKIYATVVLDIIGSTLEPIHKGRNDFLIMLSGGQFTFDLTRANEGPGLGLDIATNYYGSQSFTEMFHRRFGDQKVFTQNGLTCAVFTSGITMLTNKTSDTAGTLDYEILRKRIFLIFHWLEKIL
uniref:M28 family peptidase n=1 Tax=Candidatus Cryptobacteroides bacterium TaxID=3085639 RepID=UPI00402827CC